MGQVFVNKGGARVILSPNRWRICVLNTKQKGELKSKFLRMIFNVEFFSANQYRHMKRKSMTWIACSDQEDILEQMALYLKAKSTEECGAQRQESVFLCFMRLDSKTWHLSDIKTNFR